MRFEGWQEYTLKKPVIERPGNFFRTCICEKKVAVGHPVDLLVHIGWFQVKLNSGFKKYY